MAPDELPSVPDPLEERLGVDLDFICAPQEAEEGKQMREWIADEVAYVDRSSMYREAHRALVLEQCRDNQSGFHESIP